jgi:hypothetical protein
MPLPGVGAKGSVALLPALHSSWVVQRCRQCVMQHLTATRAIAEIARGSELTIEYYWAVSMQHLQTTD